jgi:hypothetical protein
MDEVAYYTETIDRDTAKEMYFNLRDRMLQRLVGKYQWKLIMISNARYVDDFIEQKFNDPNVFAKRITSWEAKPNSFSKVFVNWNNYNIPSDLVDIANRNPEVFIRNYMAIPSLTLEPFIKNWNAVLQCVSSEIHNPIENNFISFDKLVIKKNTNYFCHIDLGLKKDACGIAICHKQQGKIYVDLLLRFQGTETQEVNFNDIRQTIISLRDKGMLFKKITYDGWQSIDSIQILKNYGLSVEILSVDKTAQPYETLKQLLYDNKIVLPYVDQSKIENPTKPEEWLLKELRTLEYIKGIKIDHAKYSSKDVADALAGAIFNCVQEPEVTFQNIREKIKTSGERFGAAELYKSI